MLKHEMALFFTWNTIKNLKLKCSLFACNLRLQVQMLLAEGNKFCSAFLLWLLNKPSLYCCAKLAPGMASCVLSVQFTSLYIKFMLTYLWMVIIHSKLKYIYITYSCITLFFIVILHNWELMTRSTQQMLARTCTVLTQVQWTCPLCHCNHNWGWI